MKNVLVIFGGESCEHDVSVITGVMTLNAIDRKIYNPIAVYVSKNGRWYTGESLRDVSVFKNINVKKLSEVALFCGDNNLYCLKKGKVKAVCEVYSAVNCCHGGEGEGGGLYSVLALSKIPCTSAEEFASSSSMDKEFTKLALNGIGVSCLPCVKITDQGFYLRREEVLQLVKSKLDFPVIIKPSRLGSSIGIKIAKDEIELEKGILQALAYDRKVVIESALTNFREINCAVRKVGGVVEASECEEPQLKTDFLTFEDKYKGETEKKFPAEIDKSISDQIKQIAKTVYKRLGFSGVIRIDFLLCEDKIYVNEINSVPGSLAYYLFCKSTEDFAKFITELIEESVDDKKATSQKITTFESGVLNLSSCKTK